MAGSLKYFRYLANGGETFAVQRDESNVEAVNTGAGIAVTPAEKYKLPSNVSPRSATYVSLDGLVRRKIIVLSPTIFNALDATAPITDQTSGKTLFLKFTEGEKLTLPTLGDTGLLDGDAD